MPRTDLNHYNHAHALDMSHKESLIDEKRSKREIANMNERRRMQNINIGFQTLRSLLPQKHDGEKLSKAAILQHTSTYIYELEDQVSKLVSKNNELIRLLGANGGDEWNKWPEWVKRLGSQPPDCPNCKRRKFGNNNKLDIDSSPLGGDGSSTESSSEHDVGAKYKTKSFKNARVQRSDKSRNEPMDEAVYNANLMKPILINGPNQHTHQFANMADQVADEVEVASESIEIEMRSCPESPREHLLAVSGEQIAHGIFLNSVAAPSCTSTIVNQQQRIQKPNAIALPIDVPFVPVENGDSQIDNATTLKLDNLADEQNMTMATINGTQVMFLVNANVIPFANATSATAATNSQPQMIKLEQNTTSSEGGDGSYKQDSENVKATRQNLNTIVEAIRHLEGDHLFNNKNDLKDGQEPKEANVSTSNSQVISKNASSLVVTPSTPTVTVTGTGNEQTLRTQVIQRPNVIVVNNSEN